LSLEVENIRVRFGGHIALDDVTLGADSGVVTGLIGPNGAGKTTLFNVVTGVQSAERGAVRINGRSVTRIAPHRRARLGLGRTFQRLELFGSLTVRDNIRVAASLHRQWSSSRADPGEVAARLIERLGLERLADERADALSTGSGRMVELARCLACDPQVLLLDEPASGQDDDETSRFARVLTELAAEGMTVVLVEHDMELVMNVCQRIHVLDFGQLLASGAPEEIRTDATVRSAYLGDEVVA
jgi:branched-chain amino acid transport system ATP-binding protein